MPARPRRHADPRRERAANPGRNVNDPDKPTESIETPANGGFFSSLLMRNLYAINLHPQEGLERKWCEETRAIKLQSG